AAQRAPGLEWSVLVVDNSRDQARAAAEASRRAATPRLEYRLEPRRGIANARNAALAAAQELGAAFLAFTDDDAVPEPDWLAQLIAGFETPATAAVAGRIDLAWTRPRPPWLHDSALPYLSQIDWGPEA